MQAGHSPAWHIVNNGGIVLDLGAMKALTIDVDGLAASARTSSIRWQTWEPWQPGAVVAGH